MSALGELLDVRAAHAAFVALGLAELVAFHKLGYHNGHEVQLEEALAFLETAGALNRQRKRHCDSVHMLDAYRYLGLIRDEAKDRSSVVGVNSRRVNN